MSDLFGHLGCPECDLEICVHEDGWHLDHDEPENDNFEELREFVESHTASHLVS